MSNLLALRCELKKKAVPRKAKTLQGFFKTGKGEYGEGDVFLGITVPDLRRIVKRYRDLKFKDLRELLKSKIHEERLAALLILVDRFESATACGSVRVAITRDSAITCDSTEDKRRIFNFYLRNTKYINNWDLVDLSAPKIIGGYLVSEKRYPKASIRIARYERAHPNDAGSINRTTQIIHKLARSKNIWERRIAILATYAFIKEGRFEEVLKISEMLLGDEYDLIHKAVGWMLREVGKRSQGTLEKFLRKHYRNMPRTALRYAIERFPEKKRKMYLNGEIR